MQQPTEPGRPMPAESFPTDPTGLPAAARPPLLELADGDAFDLRIGAVAKRLGGTTVRMLGYNGSIPGPTLKVQQGSVVSGEPDLQLTAMAGEVVRLWLTNTVNTTRACGWRTATSPSTCKAA